MWVFELTDDVLGLGRRGDRVVEADGQVVVRQVPFNPGKLLLYLMEGRLTPLSDGAAEALTRLTSRPPSPLAPGRSSWRRQKMA
jgi:hypothetical protein